ncbi:Mitochondrial import inner membrane translocase subunit TIM8, partial [Mucuna pruriens]
MARHRNGPFLIGWSTFLLISDQSKRVLDSRFYSAISFRSGLCDIREEQQRAMVNEMVAKLTSECWDKCITGTPGNKFSSGESNCLSNCAQRYLEMSMLIMKRFQVVETVVSKCFVCFLAFLKFRGKKSLVPMVNNVQRVTEGWTDHRKQFAISICQLSRLN